MLRIFSVLFLMFSCSGKPPGVGESSGDHPVDLPPPPMLVAVDAGVREEDAGTQAPQEKPAPPKEPDPAETAAAQLAKLPKVELAFPQEEIRPEWIPFLGRLVEAARVMDELFLLQVSPENPGIRDELVRLVASDPSRQPLLELFTRMYGPWNRLQDDKPFWGKNKKPAGAGFYHPSITRERLTAHLLQLRTALETERDPRRKADIQKELDGLTSRHTLVGLADGNFTYTPYHERFRPQLAQVQASLLAAAQLAPDPSMARYLKLRARDLLEGGFAESDAAWLDVRGPIDFLIGPYDVYEDALMGYKAAYMAYLGISDPQYAQKLSSLRSWRYELDAALPYDRNFRNSRGRDIPLAVVNLLYSAGEAGSGVQLALDLPNDEETRRKKGHKLVLFRNVAQAKFDQVLLPVARLVLNPAQLPLVTFDAFFTHLLHHEFTHGLGPAYRRVDGREVEIRTLLADGYAVNEEAKADMGALVGMEHLVRTRRMDEEQLRSVYVTFVASVFRGIRFGADEPRARAGLMALLWLVEKKAVLLDPVSLTASVDFERMPAACRELAAEILKIQTTGDAAAAAGFEKDYGSAGPVLKKMLARLATVPVDITPVYPLLEKLN